MCLMTSFTKDCIFSKRLKNLRLKQRRRRQLKVKSETYSSRSNVQCEGTVIKTVVHVKQLHHLTCVKITRMIFGTLFSSYLVALRSFLVDRHIITWHNQRVFQKLVMWPKITTKLIKNRSFKRGTECAHISKGRRVAKL